MAASTIQRTRTDNDVAFTRRSPKRAHQPSSPCDSAEHPRRRYGVEAPSTAPHLGVRAGEGGQGPHLLHVARWICRAGRHPRTSGTAADRDRADLRRAVQWAQHELFAALESGVAEDEHDPVWCIVRYRRGPRRIIEDVPCRVCSREAEQRVIACELPFRGAVDTRAVGRFEPKGGSREAFKPGLPVAGELKCAPTGGRPRTDQIVRANRCRRSAAGEGRQRRREADCSKPTMRAVATHRFVFIFKKTQQTGPMRGGLHVAQRTRAAIRVWCGVEA